MITGRTVLIALELLAASTWVGSLVCLALVARVARRALDEACRVSGSFEASAASTASSVALP